MPNQGNKSNGKSGVVQPKKNSTMPSTKKQGTQGGANKSQKADAGSNANSGK